MAPLCSSQAMSDAFDADYLAGIYITNVRIYDVLLTLLESSNPSAAKRLDELHALGGSLMSNPILKTVITEDTDDQVEG